MNTMLQAYIGTMLWAKCDEDGVLFNDTYNADDIHPDAVKQAVRDIENFIELAGALLDGEDDEQIGHDFWLTRNRHGAGFWDGEYEETKGQKLTEISKSFGPLDVYVGDDGKLHTM